MLLLLHIESRDSYMSLQLAVLASGNGSNFQAVLDSIHKGVLNAKVNILICNQPEAYVIERAKKAHIPFYIFEYPKNGSRESVDKKIVDTIQRAGADTVVLAGYMRLLSSVVIQSFPGRILNIHPSLLPAFPGLQSIEEAYKWGTKFTGCTVHFVDEMLDHGQIIIQASVPISSNESLKSLIARVHQQEHRIYPQALQWLASDRLEYNEKSRIVSLRPCNTKPTVTLFDGVFINPPLEEGF